MMYVDILLGIPLLWGAIMGFKKGLVIELASIAALLLGIYGAVNFSEFTAIFLNEQFQLNSKWLGLIAFTLTFIAIVIAVFLLGKIIDKMLKLVALGLINRLLGMVFGFLKYALILSVLLFFYKSLNEQFQFVDPKWEEESLLYQGIHLIIEPLKPLYDKISLSEIPTNLPELP